MSADFRNLGILLFENIKVFGMYEWKMKPFELIVNTSFSVIPIWNLFLTENIFKIALKNKLSLSSINKAVREIPLAGWKYDGSRFTYGHDYAQVHLENQVSSLGVDLIFIQTDEKERIEQFYQDIAPKIGKLEVFKSSEFFIIRPGRKNAQNKSSQFITSECSE